MNKQKETVKMSINDFERYVDDESIDIAVAKITFLSNKPNSHKYIYSEEILKEYSNTFLGKYVVAEYDKTTDDSTTHTGDNMQIIGHVPENQEVVYTYDENGYLKCSVDVSISKIYATDMYEVLKRDGLKSVSVEAICSFSIDDVDKIDGIDEKEVLEFYGIGITVLGKMFLPSVPNAQLKMTQMSNKDFETQYVQYSKKHTKEIVNDIDIEMKEGDEQMADTKISIENEKKTSSDELEETEDTPVENNSKAINLEEKPVEEDVQLEEKTDEQEETKDTDEEDKDTKMSDLETMCSKLELEIQEKDKIIQELQNFKTKVNNAEKETIIESTMAQVKELTKDIEFEETEITKFRKAGELCDYENINAWHNEVIASTVEITMNSANTKVETNTEVIVMETPVETPKYNSIYD